MLCSNLPSGYELPAEEPPTRLINLKIEFRISLYSHFGDKNQKYDFNISIYSKRKEFRFHVGTHFRLDVRINRLLLLFLEYQQAVD